MPGPIPSAGGKKPPTPREVPCLMVRKGNVLVPGPEGPVLLRTPDGVLVDAFDAFDRLTPTYRRIYIVDLDGLERNEPQLGLWPELAREADLWIDGGVQVADQSIDILVAGARRAVLSTARLRSRRELEKAWGLSQELAMELEVGDGRIVSPGAAWSGRSALEVAKEVRSVGPTILVLSFRTTDVDWELVRAVSSEGPTWAAGTYPFGSLDRAVAVGARGGIFHPDPASLVPVGTGATPDEPRPS